MDGVAQCPQFVPVRRLVIRHYIPVMDTQPEWTRGLREWAAANSNVQRLWLFGSRARGDARLESHIDLV